LIKRMLSLFTVIIVLISILLVTPAFAATNFVKSLSNPLIIGTNDWEDILIGAPCVIYDESLYKMWYSGLDEDGYASIGHATSPNGIDWTKHGTMPVLSRGNFGDWDQDGIGMACVIKDGSGYSMWYTGVDYSGLEASIGYATSPDGINWTKNLNNPVMSGTSLTWDADGVALPSVIKQGAGYKMWYSGRLNDGTTVGNLAIGFAESNDGIMWTNNVNNPVFAATPLEWDRRAVGACCVMPINGYTMFYTGFEIAGSVISRIGKATSADGIHWNRITDPVLEQGLAGEWDERGVASPSCLVENGSFRLWYTGAGYNEFDDLELQIGLAETPVNVPSSSNWSLFLLIAVLSAGITVLGLWRSGRLKFSRG